jgi:mono/diheme cytochrome c family protein
MRQSVKVILLASAMMAVAAIIAACGTQRIEVPKSSPLYAGALLFSQRCAGCHTLSYAGTHGSAPNIRTAQANSGPNFNVRCERPIDRVLYAIENGGDSGAYMPQNVVVGQDAINVAKFVSTYAGRAAPKQVGVVQCVDEPIGTLPPGSGTAAGATGAGAGSASAPTATTVAAVPASKASARAKSKSARS